MDIKTIKEMLFRVMDEYEPKGSGYFQEGVVLIEVSTRLNIRNDRDSELALLTIWSDLFRNGYLAEGIDLNNLGKPFFHKTEKGRKVLEYYSRDPGNPEGYLPYIKSKGDIHPIAYSYVEEAVRTYNNNCYKAAAVMIGGASESIIFELNHAFVSKLNSSAKTIPNKLKDWRIKTIIDGLGAEITGLRKDLPQELFERFAAYWQGISNQIRMSRNDAGHPSSIDPVKEENVHASLLLFPNFVELIYDLKDWITKNLK